MHFPLLRLRGLEMASQRRIECEDSEAHPPQVGDWRLGAMTAWTVSCTVACTWPACRTQAPPTLGPSGWHKPISEAGSLGHSPNVQASKVSCPPK